MKKAIHIIIIIAFLIAICTIEQIMAQAYLKEAKKQVENLISISSQPFNEKTDELMFYTNELEKYWTEKENILCTFVNHREIEDIGIEISKLQTAIKNNEQKTKNMLEVLNNLNITNAKVLVVLDELNDNICRAARNLANVKVITYKDVNSFDVVSADIMLMTESSLQKLEEVLSNE